MPKYYAGNGYICIITSNKLTIRSLLSYDEEGFKGNDNDDIQITETNRIKKVVFGINSCYFLFVNGDVVVLLRMRHNKLTDNSLVTIHKNKRFVDIAAGNKHALLLDSDKKIHHFDENQQNNVLLDNRFQKVLCRGESFLALDYHLCVWSNLGKVGKLSSTKVLDFGNCAIGNNCAILQLREKGYVLFHLNNNFEGQVLELLNDSEYEYAEIIIDDNNRVITLDFNGIIRIYDIDFKGESEVNLKEISLPNSLNKNINERKIYYGGANKLIIEEKGKKDIYVCEY